MKAILMLDEMPKSCEGCPCTDYMFCYATQKELEIDWEANKPLWCPLKPMPKPKEFTPLDAYEHDADIYAYGWNACLKEIER